MLCQFNHVVSKILAVFLLLFCIALQQLHAQRKMLHGYVLDKDAYSPLPDATVLNADKNKKTLTDIKGIFSLSVADDELIFFSADGYHFDTLRFKLNTPDTIIMYLTKLPKELPGVTVSAKGYTQYQHDSVNRLKEFNEKMVAKQYSPVSNNKSGAGMVVNLDFFSSREKIKRKDKKFFEQQEINAYMNYRFSDKLVTAYTGLKGDKLSAFKNENMPSYEWLREHTSDEDIFYYINEKLPLFLKKQK